MYKVSTVMANHGKTLEVEDRANLSSMRDSDLVSKPGDSDKNEVEPLSEANGDKMAATTKEGGFFSMKQRLLEESSTNGNRITPNPKPKVTSQSKHGSTPSF